MKLLLKVTDDLDITAMAHYEETVGRGFNFVYLYITPGANLLGVPAPFMSQAVLLPGITPSANNLVHSSPVTTAGASHRDNDVSLIVEKRLAGGCVFTSTTAYQHEDQH